MKAGVHVGISAADYHADCAPEPSLSSSIARTLLTRSPLHAWTEHPRLNPDFVPEENTQFDLGTAAHAMLLEGPANIEVIDPENYPSGRGVVPKGWTNDSIRAARDASRAAGLTPVLPADMAEIEKMVVIARASIAACEDLGGMTLADGTAEQTLLWQEDGDGIWCRCRPDWMSHTRKVQISYKSTATSANPAEWVRTMMGIGADVQDAFYLRGNRATGGPQDSTSLILVQENSAPYACAWLGLDPAFLAMANEKVEEAIELWRRCLESGKWPGYLPRVHWVEPPVWAQARWEERGTLTERSGGQARGKMFSAEELAGGIPL